MKIYISHASAYDYEKELYQPIRDSKLYNAHEFFLPHESQNIDKPAKEILASADLLIAEASYPSTGQGIELGLAYAGEVQIVCFYKEGAQPSAALRFVCKDIVAYKDKDDLIGKIANFLKGHE